MEGEGPTQNDNAVFTIVLLFEPLSNRTHLLHYTGIPVIFPKQQ